MIDMISDVFNSYNYTFKKVEVGTIFQAGVESAETAYWLVVQENDLTSLVDRQADLFNICKQSINDSSLDKNITLLILWETGGNLDIPDMKKKVMSVEEDSYFFKKHVLYYSNKELDDLKEKISGSTLNDFLKNNISSQDVFSRYKSNPLFQEWQSLLYRIAIKIPFIDIDIGMSNGLESLFEKNESILLSNSDSSLVDIDREFFNISESNATPENYLEKLLPLINRGSDDK